MVSPFAAVCILLELTSGSPIRSQEGSYGDGVDSHGGHTEFFGKNNRDYGRRRNRFESGYGDRVHADERSHDNKRLASHDNISHENADSFKLDAEGIRRFSYISAGSGPEGTFVRGFYGSIGYDDSKIESKRSGEVFRDRFHRGNYRHGNDRKSDSDGSYEKSSAENRNYHGRSERGGHHSKKNGRNRFSYSGAWMNAGYSPVSNAIRFLIDRMKEL